MPTELEELVEFISHGNTQVRQLAVENLVPFSLSQPAIFKTNQLLPVKDLKLLVRDYKNPTEPNANLLAMLLANLAKWDDLKHILNLERPAPKELQSSNKAIDQLLDLFVKGAEGTYNKDADFDYLAYFFADLAKHEEGRKYFLSKQDYDASPTR
ncbi:putative FAM203 family protein [Glarea lozoyensis 74030]|uniref:Putative FAM203 family protein n=1 Tax=Glarea lozoyensis (strain ATCC 74030 / MF5533) TaxID=1104152 RepID=H0EGX1_GLAL7|nr:putative FAM203 family protein [Glarea lozoyensis 74030]